MSYATATTDGPPVDYDATRSARIQRAAKVAPALLGIGTAAVAVVIFLVYATRKKRDDEETMKRLQNQKGTTETPDGVTRVGLPTRTKKIVLRTGSGTALATGAADAVTVADPDDPTVKHPLPNTTEVEELSRQLCPTPYEVYSVDLDGVRNCYKPCSVGFESVPYNPRAEDEVFTTQDYDVKAGGKTAPPSGTTTSPDGTTTVIKLQSARVCRALCAPRRDHTGKVEPGVEILDKSACERRFTKREMGYGPSIVKCDWVVNIGDGKNYLQGCGTTFKADYPGVTSNGTENPDCEFGRQNTTYSGDQNRDFCVMHTSSGQVKMTPIACGLDYELLPANKAAYFTYNMYGGAAGFIGSEFPIGMRCFKRCPAFSTQIPWGSIPAEPDGRSHYCAEPCPRNTRESPANVNACVKDGYNQEIVLEDMGKEITKLLLARHGAAT